MINTDVEYGAADDAISRTRTLAIMKGMLRPERDDEDRSTAGVWSTTGWNSALHTLAKKIVGVSLLDPSPLNLFPENEE